MCLLKIPDDAVVRFLSFQEYWPLDGKTISAIF